MTDGICTDFDSSSGKLKFFLHSLPHSDVELHTTSNKYLLIIIIIITMMLQSSVTGGISENDFLKIFD